jgi:predicted dehydrogenase
MLSKFLDHQIGANLNHRDKGLGKPLGLIVIGLGSIGKKHLRGLGAKASSVIAYDPNQLAADSLNDLGFMFSFHSDEVEFLREVANSRVSFRYLVFISSWADSHLYWLEQVTGLGIRDVYCEKPLTNSVSDSWGFVERLKTAGVNFYVGYFRRLTKYQLALKQKIGEINEIAVIGGTGCLITNGSHWVDLAVNLFGEPPEYVSTFAKPYKISPRSAEIETWCGSSSLIFPGDRRLIMSFSSRGSRKAEATFFGDKGSLTTNGSGQWTFKGPGVDQGSQTSRQQNFRTTVIHGSNFDLDFYPHAIWADFAGKTAGQTSILRPSLETELTIQLSVLAQLVSAEGGGKPISIHNLTQAHAQDHNSRWNVT